jgi:hypothetical protein
MTLSELEDRAEKKRDYVKSLTNNSQGFTFSDTHELAIQGSLDDFLATFGIFPEADIIRQGDSKLGRIMKATNEAIFYTTIYVLARDNGRAAAMVWKLENV